MKIAIHTKDRGVRVIEGEMQLLEPPGTNHNFQLMCESQGLCVVVYPTDDEIKQLTGK